VWSTIRELNVSDIRESADQPLQIALIGAPELRQAVLRALWSGGTRYPATARVTIREYDIPLPRDRQSEIGQSDMTLLVVDAHTPIQGDVAATADKLAMLAIPRIVVLIGTDRMPDVAGDGAWYLGGTQTVFTPDAQPATLLRLLAPAIVEQLPDDLKIAAARKIPGLRDGVGRWLIGDVSFSNASYALASGLPEMIPLLTLPLNAADMVVLSKNQVLLTYKLALAFGAPADFQAQMREVLPVIGSGFLWRQVARQLVGLIPGFGLLPKVAVAYAGTYATGQAAALWYRNGEALSSDALKKLYRQAMVIGRDRARELLQRRKEAQPPSSGRALDPAAPKPRFWQRFWPFRRRK
jgi:uncharacterized protein (DUF697 family)